MRMGDKFELRPFNIAQESIGVPRNFQAVPRENYLSLFLRLREHCRIKYFGSYFDPDVYNLRIRRTLLLTIYAQSYLYFEDVQQTIHTEFGFRKTPEGLDTTLAGMIAASNSVCLHLRRTHSHHANGNVHSSAAYHGMCSIEYYNRALQELVTACGALDIFIFTDDIAWAQQNTHLFDNPQGSIHVIDESDTIRSFYLMRLCRHFIIANSSFSWWAAWLGKYPKKAVYAPLVWNIGQRRFPNDLIPENWKIVR